MTKSAFFLHFWIRLTLVVLMGGGATHLFAQQVVWIGADSLAQIYIKKQKLSSDISDYEVIEQNARRIKTALMQESYWLAEYQIDTDQSPIEVRITAGHVFQWKHISFGEKAEWIIQGMRREPKKNENPVAWIERLLVYYENNGFPFVSLHFDSLEISGGDISAHVEVEPGPLITIDSIAIKGYDKLNRPFFRYRLGIYEGQVYSEQKIRESIRRMERVEYTRYSRDPQVLFSKEKNILFLYIEEEKNNAFSGIAGLNSLPEGGVTITGEVDVRLLNSLKLGEDVAVQWRRPGVEMQMLDLEMSVPFPFHLPLELEGEIHFLRQDSSFLNLQSNFGARFFVSKDLRLRLFYEGKSSSILSDQTGIEGAAGFNSRFLRLGLIWDNTNHFLLPTRGLKVSINGGNGRRQSEGDDQNQWIFDGDFRYYQPIYKRLGFFARSMVGQLYGQNLLANEVFRLGGVNSMRGFNEQSIFASSYLVQNIELRYAIDRFSYFNVLGDFGLMENTTGHNSGRLTLFGIGAGMSFQTELGILNLIYAVGKTNDQPFDFPSAKIHIGYINRF
ncbi:MAG: BamA/TamA family outer membrane protein [Cryomorphaceae bacterium]|nr:BamA/TamA family outer membrane protein [Cryomorphaceae bacterium]